MAAFTALAIAGLASAGISAYGQWRAGRSAAKAGELAKQAKESEAQLEDYNAHVADLQTGDAIFRGQEDEERIRDHVRGLIGRGRAGAAGAGVLVGVGSSADVAADAAYLGELDALQVRTNAAREAWGYNVQAYDTRQRAKILRQEGSTLAAIGREQRTAARLGAASTLVGASASLLERKYGYDRMGRG